MRFDARRLVRVVACLTLLAQPAGAVSARPEPGLDLSWGVVRLSDIRAARLVRVADEPDKDDDRCKQGARTTAFGWLLVDYGLATAKYLVGLLLIPVGLAVVAIGWVLEVVDAVACG